MASVYVCRAFSKHTDEAVWDSAMNIDLQAAFLCARAAVPHMRAAEGGRIVNFSDWVAASGRPRYRGYLAYYVAKKAVIGLTEALALELAAHAHPGQRRGPRAHSSPRRHDARTKRRQWRPPPRSDAGAARQRSSRRSLFCIETDFMTGETIRVDGGRHLR